MALRADGSIDIRTFERGVERETLSCGTACVAAGIVAEHDGWSSPPVVCHTRAASRLTVGLARREGAYERLTLEGDARVGNIWAGR